MILTTNPDPDHKLREVVDWYIGDNGRPDQDRNGVERYFVMDNGKFVWADNAEDLIEHCDTSVGERPMKFQGIFGTIHDNPLCIQNNAGYLTFLKNLEYVEKERLYYGSWDVREQKAHYFKREWLKKADRLPHDCTKVRSYDKASSEKTKYTPKPDFTACIGVAKSPQGDIYIYGDFHTDFCDKDSPEVKGRFRKLVGERDFLIERQAIYDDPDQTMVILPRDSGAAGKYEFVASAQKLASIGCTVREDAVNPHKSKLMRATPLFSACENGYVYIVESTFNPATLEAYLSELESFDGERSTSAKKDDWVDATSTGFNYLIKVRAHKTVVRNQIQCETSLAKELPSVDLPNTGLPNLRPDPVGSIPYV